MERRGTLYSFNAGNYTASVKVTGSRSAYLDGIAVNRGIPAAEMQAGRDVIVIFFEETDPTDAMLIAIH